MVILVSAYDIEAHPAEKFLKSGIGQIETDYRISNLFIAVRTGTVEILVFHASQSQHMNLPAVTVAVEALCHEVRTTALPEKT